MRCLIAGLFALLALAPAEAAGRLRAPDTGSTAGMLNWINSYRHHPRPKDEERFMAAEFGEAYARYREQVAMLVPFMV